MKRRTKTGRTAGRAGNRLAIVVVALIVLLLLARMIAFVAHVRRHEPGLLHHQ